MCFVFIWEQTATCATCSINWMVFITERKSVYSAVRTGSLNKAVCKGLMEGSKIARTELNTVYLYQHYSLYMPNKLQYAWRGDYCECVLPAQLPVLTWSSNSIPPRTKSTIRSPHRDRAGYKHNISILLQWQFRRPNVYIHKCCPNSKTILIFGLDYYLKKLNIWP